MAENYARRSRSRIYRDIEIEKLVIAGLEQRLNYADIRTKCIEKFGLERSPSISAISRYYQSLASPSPSSK
jgi:hypothetical protein